MDILMNQSGSNREFAEIYQVAHMYYDLGLLQEDIAGRLYLSRPKVSRLLKQARDLGIVEIRVKKIIDRFHPLEDKLCKTFGLKDAVVITDYDENMDVDTRHDPLADPDAMYHIIEENVLSQFAAMYLKEQLKPDAILGYTTGHTVGRIMSQLSLPSDFHAEMVQLMGSTTNSLSANDIQMIISRMAASCPGVKVNAISAPLYISDLYLKEILLQDPIIHATMRKMAQCDLAITGISKLESGVDYHISWHGQMGPNHIAELTDRGSVGSICAQYFNKDGIKVSSEWNAKLIAMNLNDFSKIETRIGVAQGRDKLPAITGALRGKYINILITDANTASDLIKLEELRRKKSGQKIMTV